jgi:Ribbon-helix-helix protein
MTVNPEPASRKDIPVPPEDRTARLTVLVDPRKKAVFERLCADEDTTPSQVVRRLIRRYIEERTGQPWVPPAPGAAPEAGSGAARPAKAARSRRRSREHE